MGHPQHHPDPEILRDLELAIGMLDDLAHLCDFALERLFVQQSVRDVAVERIARAETRARVRAAEVLLHFPDHTHSGPHEGPVDFVDQRDRALPILGLEMAETAKREQPHGEIVEVLAVPIRRLADANASLAAEHALDLGDEPARLLEKARVFGYVVERYEQHQPEGIGPQISRSIGPDPRFTHPLETIQRIVDSMLRARSIVALDHGAA